jgi:hypothetical protein
VFRDFYCGDHAGALQRLRAHWRRLQESQMLRVAVLRVQYWQMRGACTAALADQLAGQACELRREARSTARVLLGESLARALPMARMIEAAFDLAEGRADIARARLRESAEGFEKLQMQMYAAAARARLAALEPGAAAAPLMAAAERAFAEQCVVKPMRLVGLIAPGFGQRALS